MRNIIFGLLLLCFTTVSFSAVEGEVERETQGFGATYEEALTAALLEAVRQVRGIDVGSVPRLRTEFSQFISPFSSVTLSQSYVEQGVYSLSKGRIKSYKVKDVVKPSDKDGGWQVTALVVMPVYEEVVTDDKRRTIAVLPFNIAYREAIRGGTGLVVDNIAERLSEGILTEINHSKKFAVLNRSYNREFYRENGLLASEQVAPAEASRLGRKLGADLMVVGKIHRLVFEEKPSFYGMKSKGYDVNASLFYSVVEAPTGKILWADTLDYEYGGRDDNTLMSEFITGLSSAIVTQIMDTVYPVKVLELQSEDHIILDQGGKRLVLQQMLDVFAGGRDITDPDTGLLIKVDGPKVARIEVVDIRSNYAVAKWISGDYKKIAPQAITRKTDEEAGKAAEPDKPLTSGSSDKPWQW